MPIKRLTIIGLGLIGGSLACALRKASFVEYITGCDLNLDELQQGQALGVIDAYTQDIGLAVREADIVFVAVPLGAMREVFAAVNGKLPATAIITDSGSAKASVIDDFVSACPQHQHQFVPGHPIAGTENSGVAAAFATLYQKRRVILTPTEATSVAAIHAIKTMWEACGAEVVNMQVVHHDEMLAATSHLPHMLAYALVDLFAEHPQTTEIFQYAAGGFRDFSRIASSNPTMWRDICLANKDAISQAIQNYVERLQQLATAVQQSDGDQLLETFLRAKKIRDQFIE